MTRLLAWSAYSNTYTYLLSSYRRGDGHERTIPACAHHTSPPPSALSAALPSVKSRRLPSASLRSGVGEITARMGGSRGEIRRLVLSKEGRTKLDASPDTEFYASPRLVKHVDEGFLAELTQLYRELIPEGAEVLDLMSSWVSHLPPEARYTRVVGHGLNAAELARNRRLDSFFVEDLNSEAFTRLEGEGGASFDAVVCAVGVQYLQQPERVFAEVYRVLRPGGVCVVSFSNRMFYDKAVAAWREGTPFSRTQLVVQYFAAVSGFTQPEVVKRPSPPSSSPGSPAAHQSPLDWLLGLLHTPHHQDPFYAVVSYRDFKPL